MSILSYDRKKATAYANQWAKHRNPQYYDYSNLGGDCTNFASQCIYTGAPVMNHSKKNGWYYISPNNHSPSWTGVNFLYQYLIRKTGVGPFGHETDINGVQIGDISQFQSTSSFYTHTQVIIFIGEPRDLENIFIAAHTIDSLNRPLSTYTFKKIRFIHIDGIRQ